MTAKTIFSTTSIHLKFLLRDYYLPGTVAGKGDKELNQIIKALTPWNFHSTQYHLFPSNSSASQNMVCGL